MRNLTGKTAMIAKLTEGEKLVYPDLKIGMIVEIDHEHFNGGSFYVRLNEKSGILGRVDRAGLVVEGVDRTKPSWGNKNGNLIVRLKKNRTYKMTVGMGFTQKGKPLFLTYSGLKSIFSQLQVS